MAAFQRRIVFLLGLLALGIAAMGVWLFVDEPTEETNVVLHEESPTGESRVETSSEPPRVRDPGPVEPPAEPPAAPLVAPATVTFVSEVIDAEHQQPIVGARIVARSRSGEIAAECETKGYGRFELAGLEDGKDYALEIRAPGFVVEGAEIWIHTGETKYTSIRMRRALALTGRVIDESYLGVKSRIEIRRGTRRIPLETSSDGTFRVEDLPGSLGLGSPLPDRIGGIRVRGELHRDAYREITRLDLEQERPLEIQVERGARIAGRVVAQGGVPLPGVEILAYPVAGSRDADLRIAHSSADGSFAIAGLPRGPIRIEPQHMAEGLVPALRKIDVDLAEGGERAGLELAYTSGLGIAGRVVNSRDESALPGMLITLHHEDWLDPTEVRTDEQGRFRFEPLPEGTYSVAMRGRGWRDPRQPKVLTVSTGRDDLRFDSDEPLRTASVRVTLRDRRSAEPVVGSPAAIVRLYEFAGGLDLDPERSLIEAPIDDTGTLMIDRLAVGRHRIEVKIDGYALEGLDFDVMHDGESLTFEMPMVAGVEIRGRVFDDRGIPIEGAKVEAFRVAVLDGTLDPDDAIATDRDGHFVLTDVAPDAARIAAVAPGFAPGQITLVPERDAAVPVGLRLGRGHPVSGVIYHRNGARARHLEIELVGAIAAQTTVTDGEGRFTFDAVEAGYFRIRDAEGQTLESGTNDGFGVHLEIYVRDR